jgi:UDP-N-acetylglucosamine 2-epimerase (non-hydrolysing)
MNLMPNTNTNHMIITLVAGARPNFMKIAPIIHAIHRAQKNGASVNYRLVHTGQHYDKAMSGDFFEQLSIPEPHANLACGGGSQAIQTASILVKFEEELSVHRPDLVLVVGDVTSTMACTLAAKKMGIDVAHVEAGIRSGDMSMPEEINRIVTDSICDHYFTTSETANEQLRKQQVSDQNIHFVGNTMIDTLLAQLPNICKPVSFDQWLGTHQEYFLLTLHRPSNVDDPIKLQTILSAIEKSTQPIPILFPVHPRTRQVLEKLKTQYPNMVLIEPQGYLQFIYLVKHAKGIITDSGGITEEATVLHVPCLTMRNSTERPETVTMGTNELIGDDLELLSTSLEKIKTGLWKSGDIPPLWDGKTAERIVEILIKSYH